MKKLNTRMPIIFVPHGGGPMPVLNEPNHRGLIRFLKELNKKIKKPKAILMVSAHWEEKTPTVSSAKNPDLIYDYYGFPKESYNIKYPAQGSPKLAEQVAILLKSSSIEVKMNEERGLGHGTFVPLKLIYPEADIPVVQLSLINSLDPEAHINIGKAISELANEGVLIIGSGLSFHNLSVLMQDNPAATQKSEFFDQWLNHTLINKSLSKQDREKRLINWDKAPEAKFSHPREEHLLPLLVCFGAAKTINYEASNIFNEELLGVRTSGFLWQ